MYSFGRRKLNGSNLWWREPPVDSLPFDFCRDTSLHGLKYIQQPRRHVLERIFWLLAFITFLIISLVLIHNAWGEYTDRNIITVFEPKETPVDEIPFPAVTVCNMNKVQKTKVDQMFETLRHLNFSVRNEVEEAVRNIIILHHVCNVSAGFSKKFNFSLSKGAITESDIREYWSLFTETNDENLNAEKFLQFASQNCSDMIPICIWQGEVLDCSKLFNPIETEFGKCCTFNMVPQSLLNTMRDDVRDDPEEIRQWKNWNTDKDSLLIRHELESDGTYREFPRRQKRAGKTFGLSILLNPDLNDYYCTTSDSMGFRLATHLSTDAPHVADFGIAVPPNGEVFVNVRPEVTLTDEAVKSYSVDKRACYFPQEYPLKYFKYYTSSNCMDECVAQKTFEECECVRYYMPRDDNQTLCGVDTFSCAERIKKKYLKRTQECSHCLRACTEISYNTETTVTNILNEADDWMFQNGSRAKWHSNNVSIVHIYLGKSSIYARTRKELNSPVALLASMGGIMGLCLGFSVLSLVEFMYYFTFRFLCERSWRRRVHSNSKAFEFVRTWRKSGNQTNQSSSARAQVESNHSNVLTTPPGSIALVCANSTSRDIEQRHDNNGILEQSSLDFNKPVIIPVDSTDENSPKRDDDRKDNPPADIASNEIEPNNEYSGGK